MYNLDVNTSLQIFRGHSATTNEMMVSTTYGDLNADGSLTPDVDFDTNTSGTSPKIFVSSPGNGIIRQVKRIEIQNQDTVADTITIVQNNGIATNIKKSVNIPSGFSQNYEDANGWYATDTNGFKGFFLAKPNNVNLFLNGTGQWSTPGSGPPSGAASGDLTGTYPGPSIAANAVSNSKLAQMPASTIKGNNTSVTANALDLTVAQVQTLAVQPFDVISATLGGSTGFSTRICRLSVTARFAFQGVVIDATDADSPGASVLMAGRIYFSLKQQNVLGGAPQIILNVAANTTALPASDLTALIVQNDSSATVVDLYLTSSNAFENLYFAGKNVPNTASATCTWFSPDPNGWVASIPAGTTVACTQLTLPLTSAHIFVGNASNVATDVALSGDATLSNAGVITIKNSVNLAGSPTTTTQTQGDNSTKIATTAYVDTGLAGKTSSTLTSAHLFVGNGSNVATDTALTGDVTLTNAGLSTVVKIQTFDVNSAAPVDAQFFIYDGAANKWNPKSLSGDVTSTRTGVITISNSAITDAKVSASAAIAVSKLAAGTAGQVLLNNATPTPAWTSVSGDATISSTGVVTVAPTRSEIWLQGGNGEGSTNTCIRRFTTVVKNVGSDITLAQSAANGDTLTINTNGIYFIGAGDVSTAGGTIGGISINSNQLTTGITAITSTNVLAISTAPAANNPYSVGVTLALNKNDVIRSHSNGAASPNGTSANLVYLRATLITH